MSWIHGIFGDIENDPIAHKSFMNWFSERYREEVAKEKREKPRKQKRQLTQRAADECQSHAWQASHTGFKFCPDCGRPLSTHR